MVRCPYCGSPVRVLGNRWECGYCGDCGALSSLSPAQRAKCQPKQVQITFYVDGSQADADEEQEEQASGEEEDA